MKTIYALRNTNRQKLLERAESGGLTSTEIATAALKEMGQFFENQSLNLSVSSIRASDVYEAYKPVYFSLCNPYKAFKRLNLTVIETYGVHNNRAVYAVWNDNGKWGLLEVGFFTEHIEIKKIL